MSEWMDQVRAFIALANDDGLVRVAVYPPGGLMSAGRFISDGPAWALEWGWIEPTGKIGEGWREYRLTGPASGTSTQGAKPQGG